MEFTSENVEAAVIEFYKHPGKVNKECHEWLKSCQSSREAWQVVWPLLDPSKNPQVQFVSANMIHHKVLRCLNEIPEAELPALKERLIATVAKYIAGPEVVLTRLGLTVITNYIQKFSSATCYCYTLFQLKKLYNWFVCSLLFLVGSFCYEYYWRCLGQSFGGYLNNIFPSKFPWSAGRKCF